MNDKMRSFLMRTTLNYKVHINIKMEDTRDKIQHKKSYRADNK